MKRETLFNNCILIIVLLLANFLVLYIYDNNCKTTTQERSTLISEENEQRITQEINNIRIEMRSKLDDVKEAMNNATIEMRLKLDDVKEAMNNATIEIRSKLDNVKKLMDNATIETRSKLDNVKELMDNVKMLMESKQDNFKELMDNVKMLMKSKQDDAKQLIESDTIQNIEYKLDNAIKDPKSKSSSKVAIVTEGRSGSTYLGGVFNVDPESFYIAEPLYGCHECRTNETSLKNLIRKVYDCNFLKNKTMVSQIYWDYACERSSYCNISKPEHDLEAKTIWYNLCKNSSFQVIKFIRLANLKPLQSIFGDNIKIIHLVRDPRDTINSYFSLNWHEKAFQEHGFNFYIHVVCDVIENKLNEYVYFNESNIMQVRLEDLSLEPIKKTQEIWKFLGRNTNLPIEVEKYLKNTTLHEKNAITKGFFLSKEQVEKIEQECSTVLKKLGYI